MKKLIKKGFLKVNDVFYNENCTIRKVLKKSGDGYWKIENQGKLYFTETLDEEELFNILSKLLNWEQEN